MTTEQIIEKLEEYWDLGGFLYQIRHGNFQPEAGSDFLTFLHEIKISEDALVPKRLLSLLWYLPIFLEWQSEHVTKNGNDYEQFITETCNILEQVLGIP